MCESPTGDATGQPADMYGIDASKLQWQCGRPGVDPKGGNERRGVTTNGVRSHPREADGGQWV